MRIYVAWSLVLVVLLATSSLAKEVPGLPAEVLKQLEGSAAKVNTVASDFVQEKHLSVFQEVLLSKGRFYLEKPARLRWEYLEPMNSGFSVDGKKGKRWTEDKNKVSSFDVRQDPAMAIIADQMLSWASVDLSRLTKDFVLSLESREPVVVILTPAREGVRQYLELIRLKFAKDATHITEVEVREKDGDFTRIRFYNTRVNPTLPSNLF